MLAGLCYARQIYLIVNDNSLLGATTLSIRKGSIIYCLYIRSLSHNICCTPSTRKQTAQETDHERQRTPVRYRRYRLLYTMSGQACEIFELPAEDNGDDIRSSDVSAMSKRRQAAAMTIQTEIRLSAMATFLPELF